MSDQAEAPAPAGEVTLVQVEELLRADEAAEQSDSHVAEALRDDVPEAPEEPKEAEPDQPDQPDQPRGDLRVALREERERRRQTEMQVQQLAQQQRAVANYLAAMQRQLAPQQEAPPPPPDFDTDPAGHLRYNVNQLQSTIGALQGKLQQVEQMEQQKQFMAAAEMTVAKAEESFVKQNPDYYEALDFVREKYRNKFKVLGVPEPQLDEYVRNDLRQFGLNSLRGGVNPAVKIFELAKVEGYTGSRGEAEQRLQRVAQGSAASRVTRSSAPASSGEMTVEEAAKLPISKIAAMSETQWARLMGGA